MKRPKYKEMYEWELAAHRATEIELQKLEKMHAELFEKYVKLSRSKEINPCVD